MRSLALFAAGVALAQAHKDVVKVPCCPRKATITYDKSVPDKEPFYLTQVDLCYTPTSLDLTFTAYNETNFYFDPSQGTNDDIWAYEVMEAFIHRGTNDPQTYLEFEVNPNNVTYQAFIYNPSKVRAPGAAFDHFFVSDPAADGFSATTTLDKEAETWVSRAIIPLGLFNVDEGKAKGTEWRMQFLRTVTSPETFPDQELGAWNPPDVASFHITPKFGHLKFV
jgi:hypothetical protein